jgi:signal transduction histidine kinase/PAS domain-containing protein
MRDLAEFSAPVDATRPPVSAPSSVSAAEARLRVDAADYLEGLLEGFVAYDSDWRAVYMNSAGERLLRRPRAEVLGKTWHQAFPHAAGNPVDQMYQRVMRTRTPERLEYFYAHYGMWMEIAASPSTSGGLGVYFRDVSDRIRAAEAALEEKRRLETLYRIGNTLAAELDLERVVQAVTDAATEVSGAQFGAFFYNRKNEAGESYTLYTLAGAKREAFEKFPMPRNTAVFAPTFAGTGIVRADDITQDPRYGKSAPYYGMPKGHLPVRSYLAVPVVSRSGDTLGGLFFGHEKRGVFSERSERLVAGIASQAAIAIDNALLYQAARGAEEQLREADRRKDQFLATLAHELRNPLAPIRNALQLLNLVPADSEAAGQAREIMSRQLTHLVRLVDDLLEVSRITRGKIELRSSRVDLGKVILSALETSRPAIEAAHHKLALSLPPEPIYVEGDFVRIAQVLSNLLNNAAKYTEDGGTVSLSLAQEEREAVVRVRDTGVGIPAEMLPRVFDMFAQVDGTLQRAQGGLGIGLGLARTLVELHGGRIEARSEGAGRGSEFCVRLPLERA